MRAVLWAASAITNRWPIENSRRKSFIIMNPWQINHLIDFIDPCTYFSNSTYENFLCLGVRNAFHSNETYRPAYMSYKCLLSPKPDVNLKMNWSTTKKLAYAPVCCSEETFWKRSNCRRWFLVCEPAKRCFWPGLPGSTLPYWYNILIVKPQLSGVNYITVTNIYTRHQNHT